MWIVLRGFPFAAVFFKTASLQTWNLIEVFFSRMTLEKITAFMRHTSPNFTFWLAQVAPVQHFAYHDNVSIGAILTIPG